jgi:hypothetical protein
VKALTLHQPWATLIAIGAKRIETRSWATSYRGPIAIHAAKRWQADELEAFGYGQGEWRAMRHAIGPHYRTPGDVPLGAIVAVAELTNCIPSEGFSKVSEVLKLPRWPIPGKVFMASDNEWVFGDLGPGRFGWVLSDVERLAEPIPCRGALGLWEVPDELVARINAQVEESR